MKKAAGGPTWVNWPQHGHCSIVSIFHFILTKRHRGEALLQGRSSRVSLVNAKRKSGSPALIQAAAFGHSRVGLFLGGGAAADDKPLFR
jgi:hypothetical protein